MINSINHDYMYVGQRNDTNSPTRHILKFDVFKCRECGITFEKPRPDLRVGDKVKLLKDVIQNHIRVASEGQIFKLEEIIQDQFVSNDYLLTLGENQIKVPRVYVMEVNDEYSDIQSEESL